MTIRPLLEEDTRGGFSCGEPALDSFLAKRAWSQEIGHVARTYVLVDDEQDRVANREILGFYTLAASNIERDRIRGPIPQSLPRYPMPVFYVGYFAVAESRQGEGLGKTLMADALRRCAEGAATVGAIGVFLDSLNDASTAFYRRLGFVEIPRSPGATTDDPQPMFLTMKDLIAARTE